MFSHVMGQNLAWTPSLVLPALAAHLRSAAQLMMDYISTPALLCQIVHLSLVAWRMRKGKLQNG